ncbi:hypothetical protein C7N43_34455 [Sphingobacteriales bacterium UPWRP_1]|nr:hypothetical protein B6N25_09910 [Sphingobacteriales bacterium TSM_CSS]PSJ72391.1 hypothetical protein C7N43_34455 [Sphingobacteriales bacterium UPWRP_1]
MVYHICFDEVIGTKVVPKMRGLFAGNAIHIKINPIATTRTNTVLPQYCLKIASNWVWQPETTRVVSYGIQ